MDASYDLTDYAYAANFPSEDVFSAATSSRLMLDQLTDTPPSFARDELSISTTDVIETAKEFVDWPKIVFSLLICIIGLIGNTVVIFVIVVLREYRKSVTNWYILQVAIADSVFLLSLPFKASEDLNNQWIYPKWLCKAKETVLFLNYYASVLTLMIMSIDRYIAVCHTFSDRIQALRKQRFAMITSAVTWIISLCLCAPIMMYSTVAGTMPHCRCSYIFPPTPTEYEWNNSTAFCLAEGFAGAELDWCVQLQKQLQANNEGEEHCRSSSLDQDIISGNEDYNDNVLNITQGSGEDPNLNNSFEYYIHDYSHDNSSQSPASGGMAIDCVYENTSNVWKSFLIFNFIAMFLLPILVMVLCYGLIIRRLSVSNMRLNSTSNSSSGANHQSRKRKASTKSDNDRKRVTLMCSALVCCFVIFWLPFHVGHLAKLVGIPLPEEKGYICRNLAKAGSLMVYINSAINPFLYSILGTSFKGRWFAASGTVKRSVRSRIGSADELGVRYSNRNRRNREGSTSNNTGTVETKIYKSRKAKKNSISDTKQSMNSSHVMCVTDTEQVVTSIEPNNDVETPEPQADHDETSPLKQ